MSEAKKETRSVTMKPSKFIVRVEGKIPPQQAFYYCMKVAQNGGISDTGSGTWFSDGTTVYVKRNRSGSETFIVQAPLNPNTKEAMLK